MMHGQKNIKLCIFHVGTDFFFKDRLLHYHHFLLYFNYLDISNEKPNYKSCVFNYHIKLCPLFLGLIKLC